MTTDLAGLRERLERVNQSHLLRFWDNLDPAQRDRLATDIASIDLEALPRWIDQYVHSAPSFVPRGKIEPAPCYPADPGDPTRPWDYPEHRAAGERLVSEGKVACFTVAGGQGTRLGYDGPKGCFPAGAVTGKPLFEIFAEGIRAWQDKLGARIPWYIMTSPLNHEPTVAFFEKRQHFHLHPDDVVFFSQGWMPSFDKQTGRILLADKRSLATNPDGHGGSFRALVESGALDDMRRRGVQHISYFQVDNPLVKVIDPAFIGLHAAAPDSSGEMSSKMLPKASPEERVGVFCLVDGRVRMIEYSDLPTELAEARDERGELRFRAGNPAIHLISVDFAQRVVDGGDEALPFHRAVKKVPHLDLETGEFVQPDEPNGVKLERFVFDALPLAQQSIVLETERVEEFAPIKNKQGTDSPESSATLQTERAARWLATIGVEIPRTSDGTPDCVLEISPLTAAEPHDLRGASVQTTINRGERVAL